VPRPDRVIRAARNSGPRGSRHGYPLSGQQGLPKEMISRRAGGARDPRDDVQQLERLMTVHQVAKHWQLSPRTVRRMIAQGRLPVLHFGRAVRIHPKVVAKLDSEGVV
jgi:excisionase family DNA binding protein